MARDTETLAALTYSAIITADVQMAMQQNSFRLLTLNQPVLFRPTLFMYVGNFVADPVCFFEERLFVSSD